MNLHILIANFDRVVITAFDLVVDIEFCRNNRSLVNSLYEYYDYQAMNWNREIHEAHTPLSRFISLLPRTLDDVVAQDVRNLDRMVDLHSGIDGRATVLFEVLARFLACSKEDWEIVYSGCQYEWNRCLGGAGVCQTNCGRQPGWTGGVADRHSWRQQQWRWP